MALQPRRSLYQMVKDETFAQTQPRLNLATFVTTYMDEYATKLMNEAININYIDETEYPRIAVMNAKCINIMASLWNSSRARKMENRSLGYRFFRGLYARWCSRLVTLAQKRQAQGKPTDKPNFVILLASKSYGRNSPSYGKSKCVKFP